MLKHTPSSFPFRDSNTLTAEQFEIIKVAEAGHNILVTDQAGTGKKGFTQERKKSCHCLFKWHCWNCIFKRWNHRVDGSRFLQPAYC